MVLERFFENLYLDLLQLEKLPAETSALATVAGVAAVVWTGGVVAIQLRAHQPAVKAVVGMEYLQFSFLVPIAGQIVHGELLTIAASLMALFYLVRAVRHGMTARAAARRLVAGGAAPDGADLKTLRDNLQYFTRYSLLRLPLYLLIAAFPFQFVVGAAALTSLFVGMRLIISYLHSVS
jgi:hypothetical protein